ncbi:hypothetical protein NLJ89_g1299 [Agrocybe chaxingu]|uniref:ABC transporter domain-containing protein n=1 Tax=Agrocybe chaxingu TaxID=84603 RepID=A0A9W8N0A0_9AGAR|nr:hypothetical protein NLJ89_g1299 [Agrocybe chaxingu]
MLSSTITMTSTGVSLYKAAGLRHRFPPTSHDIPSSSTFPETPLPETPPHNNSNNGTMDPETGKESILPDANSVPDSPQALPAGDPNVCYRTWGIFTVAYEKQSWSLFSFPITATIQEYRKPFCSFLCFLNDLWTIDRWHSTQYYLCMLWATMAPAVGLYLASVFFITVQPILHSPEVESEAAKDLQIIGFAWLACGLASTLVEKNMVQLRVDLGGRLKLHFMPQLAAATLRWDLDHTLESLRYFPSPYEYGDYIPGWNFFNHTFTLLRHIFTVVFQILVALLLFSKNDNQDATSLSALSGLFLCVALLSPTNDMGGSDMRSTLIKDGLAESLVEEYKRESQALGVAGADTWILGWNLLPQWYWLLGQILLGASPMVLYALAAPWSANPLGTILPSIALAQYAVFTMKYSIEMLRGFYGRHDFLSLFREAEQFYYALGYASSPVLGFRDYPDPKSDPKGMEIQGVSYKRRDADTSAPNVVEDISLTIQPGQLVVVSGREDCRKETLLKLLSGTLTPTFGEVRVDGEKLGSYDIRQLRGATVFVEKTEAIYPLSIRENILMGLGYLSRDERDAIPDEWIKEAARLGGASELVKEIGYETAITPCSIPAYSLTERPGTAAIRALRQRSPDPFPITLTDAQKQSLIALVILDGVLDALAPKTQDEIYTHFRQIALERGQTLMVSAHHVRQLSQYADLIVYMENGKISAQGSHDALLRSEHSYLSLFDAKESLYFS